MTIINDSIIDEKKVMQTKLVHQNIPLVTEKAPFEHKLSLTAIASWLTIITTINTTDWLTTATKLQYKPKDKAT